jgi:hypothetical protein
MRGSITTILLICLLGLVGSGYGPSCGYGDPYGPYWVLVGIADTPSWSIIPGKTMSTDIHRICTVLQLRAISVASAALGFTMAVFMAAGTALSK